MLLFDLCKVEGHGGEAVLICDKSRTPANTMFTMFIRNGLMQEIKS